MTGMESPATLLRCVIVEDHRMVAELVSTMLGVSKDLPIQIVATAGTVAEGIAACEQHRPDLLILDLALPDGRGQAIARALVAINPHAKIIVLSGQASTFVCPAFLNGHIHAVVAKTQAFDVLQAALRSLTGTGEASQGEATGSTKQPKAARPLTLREREILLLVGQGMRTKQIAERLKISGHTVQAHRKSIAAKLGTRGAHLTLQAVQLHQRMAGNMAPGE